MSKENFNEMMKRAFTENKAIGFTAYNLFRVARVCTP